MPYTEKERKLHASLVSQYGPEKAEEVYHGMLNSGKYDKIFGTRSKNKRGKGKTTPTRKLSVTRKQKRRKKIKAKTKKRNNGKKPYG